MRFIFVILMMVFYTGCGDEDQETPDAQQGGQGAGQGEGQGSGQDEGQGGGQDEGQGGGQDEGQGGGQDEGQGGGQGGQNPDDDARADTPAAAPHELRRVRGQNPDDDARADTPPAAGPINENKLVCSNADNSIKIEYELVAGPVLCTHPSRLSTDQCDCELREKKGGSVRVIAYSNAGAQSPHCLNRFNEIKNGELVNVTRSRRYSEHLGLNCAHPAEAGGSQ